MFIGREREIALLRERNWRDKAVLGAVYGRRRVGKTAMVEKAFEADCMWKFEGIEGEGPGFQIRNFLQTLERLNDQDTPLDIQKIDSWQEAFIALDRCLGGKEVVVFFDEFQWMAGMRRKLVSVFKWAWDNCLSENPRRRFILCGSISSFMVRNVLRSKALYGRIDTEIHLQPLSISETRDFFPRSKSDTEIIETFFVTGGIPQYLIELDPQKSLMQNLEARAFRPNGYFLKEYRRVFISHFGRNEVYEKILLALSRKSFMTAEELRKTLKHSAGGRFHQFIDDLVLADFIERAAPVDKPVNSNLARYRLKDEYLHFYYTFIYSNIRAIENETIKAYQLLSGQPMEQWRGYAFDRLCLKNARAIARALEFSGIQYQAGRWFRSQKGQKAQVDLMFIRADNIVTVCELKYTNRIDSRIVDSFEKRLETVSRCFKSGVQKVLVCGKKAKLPSRTSGYFDAVLWAEDIFF